MLPPISVPRYIVVLPRHTDVLSFSLLLHLTTSTSLTFTHYHYHRNTTKYEIPQQWRYLIPGEFWLYPQKTKSTI
ncbi:hypothetical protein SODALDRAFT_149920 [Sodiomyces alkalinus F11]|uniref:Uncharacterized protein n=1 Tax=Sodiomyces alkalinus (strain CBS 110278 / VKM F-3762 / F11) TaxID=1314773 RepID=A0A3N2PXB3_SODAK|nr:hypothetical protein SODALDRAFT_149920 [Sodiomyces alkalinus F11]ROT38985.1 hypothetical protein SODALDRAFT_149920 [Sodiomyces alkalinus F11]